MVLADGFFEFFAGHGFVDVGEQDFVFEFEVAEDEAGELVGFLGELGVVGVGFGGFGFEPGDPAGDDGVFVAHGVGVAVLGGGLGEFIDKGVEVGFFPLGVGDEAVAVVVEDLGGGGFLLVGVLLLAELGGPFFDVGEVVEFFFMGFAEVGGGQGGVGGGGGCGGLGGGGGLVAVVVGGLGSGQAGGDYGGEDEDGGGVGWCGHG